MVIVERYLVNDSLCGLWFEDVGYRVLLLK